jgi:hypothetical protein
VVVRDTARPLTTSISQPSKISGANPFTTQPRTTSASPAPPAYGVPSSIFTACTTRVSSALP